MPLVIGASLGPYQIQAPLGAGGMGEVYRATDTRLKRDVAIKVLPDLFADDPDRIARFQREAELLAGLNHPNIAAVYGLEKTDRLTAIVLELVEGETIADRLGRSEDRPLPEDRGGPAPQDVGRDRPLGRSIPLDEALPIARQIAEALEAAHEKGVIHRDLKPANIKVTPDGKVKVLDFGLAKLTDPIGAGLQTGPSVTNSPTLSLQATLQGVILGTAAYMSPEQARGKPVDRRTDIWAFGCVLYEMLAGQQTFDVGDTVSDAVASILKSDPDWTRLPADTPRPIRSLLWRCLQKDVQKRLPHIGVARLEIEEALSAPIEQAGAATVAPERGRSPLLPWAVAVSALAVAGILLLMWAPWRHIAQAPKRLEVGLGADVSLVTDLGTAVALSPDGATLAFVARKSSNTPAQLYLRRLDELQATPLSGTKDARNPFFSPDGLWIAFSAPGKVRKISVTGGAAVPVFDTANIRGGTWSETDSIIFTDQNGGRLMRMSSAGEKPDALIPIDPNGRVRRWPQALPGGRAVLFTAHRGLTGFEEADIEVQSLSDGTPKVVQRGAYFGRYVRSGHLVYIQNGTLFATPFDLDRLEVSGPAVPALQGLVASPAIGVAQFDVSNDGTLVYVPGRNNSNSEVPIQWMDREGNATPLRITPANWSNLLFAPDGRRLALDISNAKQTEVWAYDWSRDSLSQLTFGPSAARWPIWTPDGLRIAFSSTRGDQVTHNLYWQRADGTGDAQRLTESKNNQSAWSWHPSGTFLAFHEFDIQSRDDLYVLPVEGDEASGWKPGKPIVFLKSPFAERVAMFSPDGRWLAYQSNESGKDDIYVRPFSSSGAGPGKWLISTDGGTTPTWSRARKELFYATPDQRIMVVSYSVEGDSFRADKPRLWSEGQFMPREAGGGPQRSFDLHPDGNRFALAKVSETQTDNRQDKIVFVFNFFDELRRIAPAKP
jgi:Tol biopolymer transport system component